MQTVNDYYNAKSRTVDFEGNDADIVNSGVKEKINPQITELIMTKEHPYQKLVITNTVYFMANWGDWLNLSIRRIGDFWITPTESIKVPIMYSDFQHVYYAKLPNMKILEMPYVEDKISMFLLLPND